jgi:hypothetical protein
VAKSLEKYKQVGNIRQMQAMVSYHFKINANLLSFDELCEQFTKLTWVLNFTNPNKK